MSDAQFNDGTPQPLYFPDGHPRAGVFKGMAVILKECGFDTTNLCAECKNFKCDPPTIDCCCQWLLYNQPDFAHVNSILEASFKAQGFQVLFLPKFHCELNFIEQCWGYAKQLYQHNPESSCKETLQKYALAALDAVLLKSMHWCVHKIYYVQYHSIWQQFFYQISPVC